MDEPVVEWFCRIAYWRTAEPTACRSSCRWQSVVTTPRDCDSSAHRICCPQGARRAGFRAHSHHPHLVGLSTRMFTGWLEVAADGAAVHAPHTSKGFRAPPAKDLLLISNGLFAKYGMWNARRRGLLEKLQQLPRVDARLPEETR